MYFTYRNNVAWTGTVAYRPSPQTPLPPGEGGYMPDRMLTS